MFPPDLENVEVFERRFCGLRAVDTASDADDILRKFAGGSGAVRFRITYSGELKAGGKKSRREEKDRIRSYISPQLEELSLKHPVFHARGMAFDPPAAILPSGRERDARFPIGPTPRLKWFVWHATSLT